MAKTNPIRLVGSFFVLATVISFWPGVSYAQTSVEEYFEKGNRQIAQGAYDAAIESYSVALEMDDKFVGAICNQGVAYLKTNRHDQALANFNMALDIDRGNVVCLTQRAVLFSVTGAFEKALNDYNTILAKEPGNLKVLIDRSTVYFMTQQYDESISDLDKALQINPNNVDYLISRAKSYAAKGSYQKALGSLNDALAIEPKNKECLAARKQIFFLMGWNDESTYQNRSNTLENDSIPVNIFLTTHSHQDEYTQEQATETTALLNKHINWIDVKDRTFVVWLEHASPKILGSIGIFPEALHASVRESLHLSYEQIVRIMLMPDQMPKDQVAALFKYLLAVYNREKQRENDFLTEDLVQGNDARILDWDLYSSFWRGWIERKRQDHEVKISLEDSTFESWIAQIRYNYCWRMVTDQLKLGKTESAIKWQKYHFYTMIEGIRLRDVKLAYDIANWHAQTPDDIHIVLRGAAHVELAQELQKFHIRSRNIYTLNDVKIPYLEYFYRYNPRLDNHNPGIETPEQLNKIFPDERRLIIMDLMRTFYVSKMVEETKFDYNELNKITNVINRMTDKELNNWLNQYEGHANKLDDIANTTWNTIKQKL